MDPQLKVLILITVAVEFIVQSLLIYYTLKSLKKSNELSSKNFFMDYFVYFFVVHLILLFAGSMILLFYGKELFGNI